jgi:hypothetical protein
MLRNGWSPPALLCAQLLASESFAWRSSWVGPRWDVERFQGGRHWSHPGHHLSPRIGGFLLGIYFTFLCVWAVGTDWRMYPTPAMVISRTAPPSRSASTSLSINPRISEETSSSESVSNLARSSRADCIERVLCMPVFGDLTFSPLSETAWPLPVFNHATSTL